MESTFYLVQLIFCKKGQFYVEDNVFSSILGQIRMICKVSFLGNISIFIKFLLHTQNLTWTILLMIFTFTMLRKILKSISKFKFTSLSYAHDIAIHIYYIMCSLNQNGVENHTLWIFTQDKAFQSPILKLNFVSQFQYKVSSNDYYYFQRKSVLH